MIAYVKGTLEEITEQNVVIEVNGIGYNVRISAGTMGQLPGFIIASSTVRKMP